jgi:hypothetical protein
MIRDIFSNETDYDTNTDPSSDAVTVPVPVQKQAVFYIFLLLDIPSVLCSLLLFYYFICLPELRHPRESNQIIIYLLISSFLVTAIDIPLILPYLKNCYYILSMKYPYSFCIFWIMYDYSLYAMNLWLVALVFLERYLLIFFKQKVMKNKKRRFCLYYVSVTLMILFFTFWYLYLVALYPCAQTQFDFTQIVCSFPCYQTVGSVTIQNIDWTLSGLLPVFLTILFIFILISHVLYQRHKIGRCLTQRRTWKRTRKMFSQLLPITFIFSICNVPLIIVGLLAVSNPWYNTTPYFYADFLSYCLSLFMPFAVLSRQTVIRKRLSTLLRLRHLNRTAPATMAALEMRVRNIQVPKRTVAATVKIDGV